MDFYEMCDKLAEHHEREIYGRRKRLPNDEFAIAFDSSLTHEQKMEKLTAIRKAKAIKRAARRITRKPMPQPPMNFDQRISDADALRARGWGISLA